MLLPDPEPRPMPPSKRSPTPNAVATLPRDRLSEVANDESTDALAFRERRNKEEKPDILWVNWDGPDDPRNPQNWSYQMKWATTLVVSLYIFISPVSSTMVAPATEKITREFGITNEVLIVMTTSVFFLGYAIGPLFLGPLSEVYGRSCILQLSNFFYLVWNLGCGFAQNKSQLIALRFLSGLGGSAPIAIGGGVVGDIWHPEERGKAMAVYSLAPMLGPILGPVCGGWIAEKTTWRWVFWSTSIAGVVIQISGLFYLRETYAPYLLEQKAKGIKKLSDLEKVSSKQIRSIYETSEHRSWQSLTQKALVRPFQLFFGESIIQILGIYLTFVHGILYFFLTTIPSIFSNVYHQNPGISGLNYIALGMGLVLSMQVSALFMDRIYIYLKNKNGGVGEPEFRLLPMIPGTILVPFGVLLAGWSAEYRLHWVAADVGIMCVGAGMMLVFQAIQTYVVDAFTLHAASAFAAVNCLKCLAAFGFPLFAPSMYAKLGYGKGNTILACLSIALGCPPPLLIWKYGRQIRMGSKYAHKPQIYHNSETSLELNTLKPSGS